MAGSDGQSSVLFFTNFVDGVYLFNLTVRNKYNAWSSAVINVTILPGKRDPQSHLYNVITYA